MDNYIAANIPTSKAQIIHVTRGILHGIHDVFPPSTDNSKDPISAKKLQKGDGTFESKKCILCFDFDGNNKTMWLEEEKRVALRTILHQWLRGTTKSKWGNLFAEFESVTAKLQHTFLALHEGQGLLSPCNWVIQQQPQVIYIHQDGALLKAI
jgi:hypothetical protein